MLNSIYFENIIKRVFFLQFARLEDAKNALNLNGQLDIGGRVIKVIMDISKLTIQNICLRQPICSYSYPISLGINDYWSRCIARCWDNSCWSWWWWWWLSEYCLYFFCLFNDPLFFYLKEELVGCEWFLLDLSLEHSPMLEIAFEERFILMPPCSYYQHLIICHCGFFTFCLWFASYICIW